MNVGLLRKNIQESLLLFIACAIGCFAFAFFRVWIVGRMDSNRFKQIIELLPKEWERFSSVDFEWLTSYLGRTGLTLDEPLLVLVISVWVIVRASDVVSGEVSRGTMEWLLAQPLSRKRVFWTSTLVTTIGTVLLALLTWLGMWVGVEVTAIKELIYPEFQVPFTDYRVPLTQLEPRETYIPMRDVVSAIDFWPGIVNLLCFHLFLLGFTSLLSSLDRYRWRTLGISTCVYVAGGMLKLGSLASQSLVWMQYLTYFTLYEPELHMKVQMDDGRGFWSLVVWDEAGQIAALGPLGCNGLLLLLGVICCVWAATVFERRDVPAPV